MNTLYPHVFKLLVLVLLVVIGVIIFFFFQSIILLQINKMRILNARARNNYKI